jgi:hypothetical protein
MVFPLVVYELLAISATYCPTIHVNAEDLGDQARRGESPTVMGEWSVWPD